MESQETPVVDQFEILSLIHGNRNGVKRLVLLQFVLSILLIVGIIYIAQKPPLVIRIDNLGNTDVIQDYPRESTKPSEEDIRFFTKKFLDDYVALKSNLVVRQFENTLNMMTEDLAKQHLQAMKEQNTVGIIQAAGIRNDLTIEAVHTESVSDELYIKVRAILETRPIDDITAQPKIKPIQAALVLQVIPRSAEHPYGLLTKSVQIMVDQNGQQIQNNLGEIADAPYQE